MAFAPHGRTAVTVGVDGAVNVWDVTDRAPRPPGPPHQPPRDGERRCVRSPRTAPSSP
ncbi:hypothetical protein ABZ759_19825 [Streptomyces sp. NPDC047860]|uniref:hypothetical protein n=1 Tax=Streptomyces sp. NPDC047860 TaxID=3155743 RepID=UPI0033FFBE63